MQKSPMCISADWRQEGHPVRKNSHQPPYFQWQPDNLGLSEKNAVKTTFIYLLATSDM